MKKIFKTLAKILGVLLLLLLIAGIGVKLIFDEEIPKGTSGPEADALAMKVLDALNHEKFQNAETITWTFRGSNNYVWKPQTNKVTVTWDDYRVELQTDAPDESLAFKNKDSLNGDAKQDAVQTALDNFNNDSFWVVAPFKIMDPGTEREIIKEDAQEKLLVRYTSGGSTPGDVYVWKLDKDYIPQNFKMWVSIIPLDGVEAKWEDWDMTDGGFLLAEKKSVFGVEIPITDLVVE